LGLIEDIGNGPVGLDTAIFIYFIEEHHRFLPVLEPLFVAIDAGLLEGVTSGLTLLETLVAPYRVGNAALANRYEALLTRSRGIRLVELDRPLLRAAARLRASTRIKAPDALQVAAALSAACPVYLTNDRGLPSVPGLRTLQLRDYLPVA
jgi:predicted nucleic acid-binding protein